MKQNRFIESLPSIVRYRDESSYPSRLLAKAGSQFAVIYLYRFKVGDDSVVEAQVQLQILQSFAASTSLHHHW
jgi:hypothetical protein